MLIRENRPTINFMDAYRCHYGAQENVVIRTLESLPGPAPTVRLELACHRPEFVGFRFAEEDRPATMSLDNTFRIRFEGDNRTWHGTAQPVYKDGPGPVVHEIEVTLKTREDYRAEGIEHGAMVNVNITPPLEFEVQDPASWMTPQPTAEERQFAWETWGEHVAGGEGDYARARALAKVLCRELWPHTGTPIPEMQWYSPFEMYRAMVSGKSKGFCTQFGMAFVHACKCFDIPARYMHIERPIEYGRDIWLMMKGMHCTSEVFDRDLNRWIFMDLRFYCLGAYLGEEGPLNLAELHLFMCQPHWRERLRFHVYDMETGKEERLPMEDCPRPDIHFYGGWYTVCHVGYN